MRGKDRMNAKYVLRDLVLTRGGRLTKADIRNSRHFKGWEWKDIYDLLFQLRKEFRGVVGKYGQEAWEVIKDDVVGLEPKLTMYEREKIAQRIHASKIGSSELTIQQNLILKGRYKKEGLANGVITALDLSSKHLGLIIRSSTGVRQQAIRFQEDQEMPHPGSLIPTEPTWAKGADADKWYPKLAGKVSTRVMLAIRRAYSEGAISKPISELSTEELLRIRNIGEKGLAEIQKALSEGER